MTLLHLDLTMLAHLKKECDCGVRLEIERAAIAGSVLVIYSDGISEQMAIAVSRTQK